MKFLPLFLIAFSSFNPSIFAQNDAAETPQYKYAFKGYLTVLTDKKTTVFITADSTRTQTSTERNGMILPTIGWTRFRKNGRFMEIGITKLRFDYRELATKNEIFERDSFGNIVPTGDIPDRSYKFWSNLVGLRFEWNFPFYVKENRRFNAYLGVAIDPSVNFEKYQFGGLSAPVNSLNVSNTLTIIPRIIYALSNRCFLDFNTPVSFTTLFVNYRYESSSSSVGNSSRQKEIKYGAMKPDNILGIRLGIGYKFQ